jgi:superkiller protein 3
MRQMAEMFPHSALAEAFTCYYEYISEGPPEQQNKSEEDKEEASKPEEDPFDGIMVIQIEAHYKLD